MLPQSGCWLGAHLTGSWLVRSVVFRFSIREGVFLASRGRCSNILSALLFLPRFQLCVALDGGRVDACIQLDACFLVVLDSIANDAYVGAFRAHHAFIAVVVHMVCTDDKVARAGANVYPGAGVGIDLIDCDLEVTAIFLA